MRRVLGDEFEFTAPKCGNSGHVPFSNKWLANRSGKIEEYLSNNYLHP